jgi:hypothetical protein
VLPIRPLTAPEKSRRPRVGPRGHAAPPAATKRASEYDVRGVTIPARLYLQVPQANATAQRALQEFRERQPRHLWVDDGMVGGTHAFWVSYEPPFDECDALAKTREILERIEADGIDIAGISVPE